MTTFFVIQTICNGKIKYYQATPPNDCYMVSHMCSASTFANMATLIDVLHTEFENPELVALGNGSILLPNLLSQAATPRRFGIPTDVLVQLIRISADGWANVTSHVMKEFTIRVTEAEVINTSVQIMNVNVQESHL